MYLYLYAAALYLAAALLSNYVLNDNPNPTDQGRIFSMVQQKPTNSDN